MFDTPRPPVARKIPRTDVVHGDVRQDDYYWMREKDDAEVIAYLTAENAYTDAVMKPTVPFQESLYTEMLARIKEDDQSVPYHLRGYFYYSRTEKGKQYPIYCRKAGSLEAPEQVMLDLNQLAEGHPFLALGAASVSDDGRLLAYTTDLTGFRDYTLHVKDLETGALRPDFVEKVSAVAWAADNETLFYVTEDEAKRPYRLHRHRLGVAVADLLLEEPDALFRFHVGRSRSLAYLFLVSGSFTSTEVRYLHAGEPGVADGAPARDGSRVPGGSRRRPGRRGLLHPHQPRRPAELPPRRGPGGRSASRALARADRAPFGRDARGRGRLCPALRRPRARGRADPAARRRRGHRRLPSRGVPGADLRPELRRQRGVRRGGLSAAVPVADHPRVGVRLRYRGAPSAPAQAGGG